MLKQSKNLNLTLSLNLILRVVMSPDFVWQDAVLQHRLNVAAFTRFLCPGHVISDCILDIQTFSLQILVASSAAGHTQPLWML